MQKMIRDMKEEEKITESMSKQKPSKKPMQLKGTESDKKPTKPTKSSMSAKSPKSETKQKKTRSSSDDSDSNVSSMSSKSVMLVNPNLENILGKKNQSSQESTQSKINSNQPVKPPQLKRLMEQPKPKSDSESESADSDSEDFSSQSTKSTKSTRSSDRRQITLNLDDKLRQLKQSSNVTPLKMMNKTEAEKDIAFESISFGKKSDGSGSSRTGKRGRPKKAMKLKFGE
jgi:hypothetical protein